LRERISVLFICMGNACRSQMAEALAKYYFGDDIEVLSAGITPLGWIPEAVYEVMGEIDVPIENQRSKSISEIDLKKVDLIVNLSGCSLDGIIPIDFKGIVINWYVRDPYGEDLQSYRQTRDTIDWLISEKLPKWIKNARSLTGSG